MAQSDLDTQVRLAAFHFLDEQRRLHGEVIPTKALWEGFTFNDQRVQLKGIQGIFKPAILPSVPLSITTAAPEPNREPPYRDAFAHDGTLLYHYRGTDPAHYQNVGLRLAMRERRPLVYFLGIVPSAYFPIWPVYVVGEDAAIHAFRVLADDPAYLMHGAEMVVEAGEEARRAYITVTTRYRLHQQSFRTRVLRAYRERCALCRLKHHQLLDAAHIVPDSDPLGEPLVSNGLALCKLHHAAFDQYFIGIRPDLVVEVRRDVLQEEDGPMLVHGLQQLHGTRIDVPRVVEHRPQTELLDQRYRLFVDASSI